MAFIVDPPAPRHSTERVVFVEALKERCCAGFVTEMGKTVGYLRVSTQEQRPDRQIDGLQELCDELHIETLSAVRARRPVFDAVIEDLQAGDTLVVWDLDRAFRSTVDAVLQAEKLREGGIHFRIVTLQVDTATPAGMLVYTVMAAFGEYERRTISKRTREGLEAARRRGKRLGRPPKLRADQLAYAKEEIEAGSATLKKLAEEFGVAPWTLTRALRRYPGSLADPFAEASMG